MRVSIIMAALMSVAAAPVLASDCKVTKAHYDALASGMTYDQAVSVLGCAGEEMSNTDIGGMKTVMLMWSGNSMGGNMNAMFQDDKLVSKAQFGLK